VRSRKHLSVLYCSYTMRQFGRIRNSPARPFLTAHMCPMTTKLNKTK
jgi:hypothetical protein